MFPKKTSSWLDRLRSNKGIPTTQGLNLDQFLTQIPNSDQIPPKPNPSPPPPNPKWLNSISTALSELFVMEEEEEDRHTEFRRKASRKQPNPKIFIDRREVVEEKPPERAAEVEEKLDLAGYSRSDLVIIDTSSGSGNCVSWKTEKVVFRKGSVWKVREKKWKGRSLVVGRKKRKFSKVDDYDDDGSEEEKKKKKKKRMKMKKIKQKVGRIGKKGGGDEHDGAHPFQVCVENAQQVANKEIQHNLQVSMKRCKFFMPAKRSSVFGTQNTPSSKENVIPLQ